MSHIDIYNRFKDAMPVYGERVDIWFPNGRNSIRVRLTTKEEYVFTMFSTHSWRFETVDSFIKNMKGAK